jgi:hypothetical protein
VGEAGQRCAWCGAVEPAELVRVGGEIRCRECVYRHAAAGSIFQAANDTGLERVREKHRARRWPGRYQ